MIENNALAASKEIKRPTRVILLGREDLVSVGVDCLLRSHKDWEVIRILDENNCETLLQEVKEIHPDVVIFYQGDLPKDHAWVLELMHSCPGVRLITFSLETSSLDVYDKKRVWIKDITDLFDFVI